MKSHVVDCDCGKREPNPNRQIIGACNWTKYTKYTNYTIAAYNVQSTDQNRQIVHKLDNIQNIQNIQNRQIIYINVRTKIDKLDYSMV